jgi:hypothetical protein
MVLYAENFKKTFINSVARYIPFLVILISCDRPNRNPEFQNHSAKNSIPQLGFDSLKKHTNATRYSCQQGSWHMIKKNLDKYPFDSVPDKNVKLVIENNSLTKYVKNRIDFHDSLIYIETTYYNDSTNCYRFLNARKGDKLFFDFGKRILIWEQLGKDGPIFFFERDR